MQMDREQSLLSSKATLSLEIKCITFATQEIETVSFTFEHR